jgi:arylsulfatase A-like enzyme/Tfp pilus assembly protein PilF
LRPVLAAILCASFLPAGLAQHPAEKPRPNVILISVDTLRADHLSCDTAAAPKTPNICRIADGGTLFGQASSAVPLTLPSHTATLTSTYPFENGVRDNGDRLAPGSTTLASILRTHGYRTAAFVSGFVLDRRFGLDQGFDTYDGPPDLGNSGATDAGDIKRKGDQTVKAAEQWMGANADHPFFLFLHLYDLHTPYNLSAAEEKRYGAGYDGELAYVDAAMGGFLDYLDSRQLPADSIIVFTADHGEGLGDHGESTHGFFIYQSTLHVPLIFRLPTHRPGAAASLPQRIDAPASLLDVSPTILAALKLPIPTSMEGHSLLVERANSQTSSEDIYSESIYTQKHFDASALASLRIGRYKYIDAPRPEFYDLAQDPNETKNLYTARESLASAYRERLRQLERTHQPAATQAAAALSPEAVERLHALGYMTGSRSAAAAKTSQADPKDRIADYEAYGRGLQLASSGSVEQADVLLKTILEKNHNLYDVQLALGLDEQRLGKNAEALQAFQAVLAAEPANVIAHLDAGLSDYNLRNFEQAANEANAALAISPGYTKAEVLLAKSYAQRGDLEKSAATFREILAQHPDNYDAHDGLGTLAAMRGDWSESVQQLEAALAVDPDAAETRNTLGGVYIREGEIESAKAQFVEAVRLRPDFASAHYNLGLASLKLGDAALARTEFQKALDADPNYLPARDALSRLDKSK